MNYRKIVNLYRKYKFSELDKIALECAHFDLIVGFDGYHVFFNYGTLKLEYIIQAKNDLELRAFKYFATQVESNRDYLIELENELKRVSRTSKHQNVRAINKIARIDVEYRKLETELMNET